MKKVKIAHIHVWDKKNKGDLAIVMAVKDLLIKKFINVEFFDFPIEFLSKGELSDIKKLNSCDFVVIGGGGIFYHYFLPFSKELISKIKKSIFIFGTGYIKEIGAKNLKDEQLESLLFLIEKARLVALRDDYTKRFLIKNGADPDKIRLIGDPATLLKEEKISSSKSREFGLDSPILKIGFNLNYSGWLGFGQYKKEILSAYKSVADYFIKKYGARIYYLKHHPGEEQIIKELDFPIFKVVDLHPYQQKFLYSKMDLIIGMMLHSCVMSFGALTPEINLAYDLRNKSFAKFIKCPELLVELEDLKSGILLKKAKSVFKEKELYKNKFKKQVDKIKDNHENYLEDIIKIFKF
ncbi:MAG: polysaccharide pyruvyl transferase family protein [Patescibacteria group bacterium]|nr:polysaccharide pyruvyl transferase family protein [Patescibacteria group bacterium]